VEQLQCEITEIKKDFSQNLADVKSSMILCGMDGEEEECIDDGGHILGTHTLGSGIGLLDQNSQPDIEITHRSDENEVMNTASIGVGYVGDEGEKLSSASRGSMAVGGQKVQ